jgi:hypothetical protein
MAGIRLAEILNTAASQVNAKKRRTGVAVATRVPKRCKLEDNRFFSLDIDFDVNTLVFSGDTADVVDAAEAAVVAAPLNSAPSTTPRVTTTTLSPEEATKAKRKRSKARKAFNKRLVGGVDLENVVLIKRGNQLIITSHERVTPSYFPSRFLVFEVSFGGNRDSAPVSFLFDSAVFGIGTISSELLAKTMHKIRGLPYIQPLLPEVDDDLSDDDCEPAEQPSLSFKRSVPTLGPIANALTVGSGKIFASNAPNTDPSDVAARVFGWTDGSTGDASASDDAQSRKKARDVRAKENKRLRQMYGFLPTKERVWEDEFSAKLEEICMYHQGRIILYVHEATLKNATEPTIRANMFRVVIPGEGYTVMHHLIVDHRIYNGGLTDKISESLQLLQRNSRRAKRSRQLAMLRPSLTSELHDLDSLYFGTDPTRLKRLEAIRLVLSKPANAEESYFKIIWSTQVGDVTKRLDF